MISIVIPTFNRAEMLCQVLPTYQMSSLVREIIVVDDASSDATMERVTQLQAADPRIRYVRNRCNLGAPASRNLGASFAECEWILQSEDDLELGDRYLETLLEHAESSETDIIAGRRIWMRLGETKEQALARANMGRRSSQPPFNELLMDHNSQAMTSDDIVCPLVDGTMLMRRDVALTIHYHEPYGGQSTWREESDFQLCAIEKGYRVIFCPHALCFHHSRASQSFGRSHLKGLCTYAYRVFRNDLEFRRRHRSLLQKDYPRALLLGNPLLSALLYGLYRFGWLVLVEILRTLRKRRHGGFVWQ